MFQEKKEEYSAKRGGNIPVWQSDKYLESRAKAVEIIDSKKYGLTEADFWILMNETKSGKMAYTGLIISHNGCLKINDKLSDKFRPECVTVDKDGYGGSLVYSYNCPEQGIYEVGEVSASNCKISYPYAMAFKRLMDRVVLKLSKLAYSGIYSEVESDEFRRQEDAPEETETSKEPVQKPEEPKEPEPVTFICGICKKPLKAGKTISVRQYDERCRKKFGQALCWDCIKGLYPDNAANTDWLLK